MHLDGAGGGGGSRSNNGDSSSTAAGQCAARASVCREIPSDQHGQFSSRIIYDSPHVNGEKRSASSNNLDSCVTLPRRKPYLNFTSVNDYNSPTCVNGDLSDVRYEFNSDDNCYYKEISGASLRVNSANSNYTNCNNNISRAQSFKEGLNFSSNEKCNYNQYNNNKVYALSRTRSCNDGLAGDFIEAENKSKLVRVPSVDEILESVKTLRAKKNMVKSNPDLLSSQEPVYHSASLPRQKSNNKSKNGRSSNGSSLLGVRYNGTSSSSDKLYDRMPEPDYEQIPEGDSPYYENLNQRNFYENIHMNGEVIYDSPKSTLEHHYDKVPNDIVYENLNYDSPLYENLNEKEPTYMNIKTPKSSKQSPNIYANLEEQSKSSSKSKARGKVTISGNSTMQGQTYDVPRAATHIYDTPPKQTRQVAPPQENEYDTPKNNRSVLPQSTQIVLKAKSEQRQKIDDIFADCDKDSLEGDRDREPDIPSPGKC